MSTKLIHLECGLQCWTIRELLSADPCSALTQCTEFDFFELAGTGGLTCGDLSRRLTTSECPCFNKLRGAHICSIGARAYDVADLVTQYLESFPSLEWVAFFFDPNDNDQFSGSVQTREKLYQRYSRHLAGYREAIECVLSSTNAERPLDAQLPCPRILYHTYAPDFFPVSDGKPGASQLVGHDGLQLDNYFAELAGFDLAAWLESDASDVSIHSLHLTGIGTDGLHARLPSTFHDSEPRRKLLKLISASIKRGVGRLIVEHEINPHSKHEALDSLRNLRGYLDLSMEAE